MKVRDREFEEVRVCRVRKKIQIQVGKNGSSEVRKEEKK